MKSVLSLLVCMFIAFGASVEAATIEMNVNGLVCAFCAQGIEKQLRKFPATADVVVSLEHKLVAVVLKEGQDIPDADLRRALTNAGYSVKQLTARQRPLMFCVSASSRANHESHRSRTFTERRSGGRRAACELGDSRVLRAPGDACSAGGGCGPGGSYHGGAPAYLA